jgi:hypothetical protein
LGEIRAIKGEISNLPRKYAYSLSHDRDTFLELLLITSSRRLGFSVNESRARRNLSFGYLQFIEDALQVRRRSA